MTLLVACLTVDAGCMRYNENTFIHSDQSGSRLSGAIFCNHTLTGQTININQHTYNP